MLNQTQINTFHRDGCLNGGQVLSDSEVAELRSALFETIDRGPEGFPEDGPRPVLFRNLGGDETAVVWQIVNIWEACPAFERLIYHPQVVKGISQLTGMADLMVWHDQVQYKPAGKGGVNWWHQDAPLWPAIQPMTPVSAWIPLDDADEENGCMWMVPGSHKWGNQNNKLNEQRARNDDFYAIAGAYTPPADAQINEVRPICWPIRKGEVSFHHSLTWHGSPPNKSNRPRPAIAVHFMTGEATFVAGTAHPMAKFVDLPDGAPMREAGEHFPTVCRNGEPVGVPQQLKSMARG